MGTEQDAVGLPRRLLGLELLHHLVQALDLAHDGLGLLPQLAGLGLQHRRRLVDALLHLAVEGQGLPAGGGLNAAHAGGHGELALDAEGPRHGGVGQVGAAAELHGKAPAHIHHPHGVAVLLAEQGDGPALLGLLDGQHLGVDGVARQDGLFDHAAHLGHLLRGHGLEVGEVEAQPVGLHQGAGLVDVVPQHLP